MENAYLLLVLIIVLLIMIFFLRKKKERIEKELAKKERELAECKWDAEENLNRLSLQLDKQKNYYEERISLLGIQDIEEAKVKLNDLRKNIGESNSELKDLESKISILRPEADSLDTKVKQFEARKRNAEIKIVAEKRALKLVQNYLHSQLQETHYYANIQDVLKFDELERKATNILESWGEVLPLWHSKAAGYKDLKIQFDVLKREIQDVINSVLSGILNNLNSSSTCVSLIRIMLDCVFDSTCMSLKYGKLDNAIQKLESLLKSIEASIALATSNPRLVRILSSLVNKIGPLYTEAIHVEYEYWVKREQAKAEQAEIRRKIQEERAEQKRLMEEKEKLDAEREKYLCEINRLETMKMNSSNVSDIIKIDKAISDIKISMSEIDKKSEEILKLQNGKAGTVYIISNLGSFGETMFKIGMTRRLDPQDRINELSGASVPFPFDIHALIFSDDAPSLETALHNKLVDKKVNKVNSRKEFFFTSLDELQNLVNEICPTAEFVSTMLAEQYRQSVEIEKGNAVSLDCYYEENEEDEDI